ncbi:MAG: ASCH domain-containing protein [Alphaproteobacteria bacterium]|nr:ASCH domain-containing protein [Alphaproteobacteria bacterium]PHY01469.1 MAG: hypothetical protein CK529_01030 [Rhodospirillaceae bacterium]
MPTAAAPTHPAALGAFWRAVQAARPDFVIPARFAVRCIGTSPEMNTIILDLIANGQKVGTFPLPLQLERLGEPLPQPGDLTAHVRLDGTPRLLVRTTAVEQVAFKDITEKHTAIDGPTVRPLDVWRKIHIPYYTNMMAGYGLSFTEDIPLCVEHFECLYVAP